MKRDLAPAHNSGQSNEKSARRKTDDASASSSSAASTGSDSYDVFLSFSGQDTRLNFTDHLYNSLVDARIRVFRDENELREGKKIGTILLQAIKNSKISIPILSPNYASSKWCLQELVEMTECMKCGHVVLPIFYHVEPTHVRKQEGSFGETFCLLSRNHSEEDVARWKQALQEVASIKGWEPAKTADGHEAELVKKVVTTVLSELKKALQLVVTEQLVEIDDAVEDILRKLDGNPNGTQIVGIYGMGGIGKTTLAKVVYNKLLDQFRYHSFIADIRESSQSKGISRLQEQLILDLEVVERVSNMDYGIRILRSRFKSKKVLILLDDVDDIDQVRALVGNYDWFEMGSRIIITTRSRSVLGEAEVECKYKLKEMAKDISLKLFSRHAFRRDFPPCEFESLSRAIVSTTGGLPLALKVIGSFLYGQSRDFWQDALKKLRKVPHQKVQEKLRISYNALGYEGKEIFLDIACFFIGVDLTYATYMWDACDFFPKMWIEILSCMSLITIGNDGKVQMHDQLRDLGREIVRAEQYDEPNRSRLWVPKEALEVLERNKGIRKHRIRALCLDEYWTRRDPTVFMFGRKRKLTTEQFEALSNLRFLTVHRAKLIGDSISLLPELRWLMWRGCPTFVPTNICMAKLVILDLSGSDISKLWKGWSHLEMAKQLKVLDLSYCNRLKVTPNLSAFQNLEILRLEDCRNLKQIDPSIGAAKNLVHLDLRKCEVLEELPQEMCKLKKLKELYISETAIVKIPQCIGYLKKLEVLYAVGCESLDGLPDSISHLVNLSTLDLSCCPKLCKLPESIGSLVKLERLSCGYNYSHYYNPFLRKSKQLSELSSSGDIGICELPESIGDLKILKFLHISHCPRLSNLPSTISKLGNLEKLDATRCMNLRGEIHIDGLSSLKILRLSSTGISGFHGTFDKVSCLEKLELDNCRMLQLLPELPASLTVLKVGGQDHINRRLFHLIQECPMLKSMPELPSRLLTLSVSDCDELKELPSLSRLEFLSYLYLGGCGELTEIRGLEGLKSLTILQVSECQKLSYLDGLEHLESLRCLHLRTSGPILKDDQVRGFEKLKNLENLHIVGCESLVRVDVSQLTHLLSLNFCGCCNLLEIKGLERLKNLGILQLVGCPHIDALPNLSCFRNLTFVDVDERSNIPDGRLVRRGKYWATNRISYGPSDATYWTS